jgi:hypothetical protein
VIAAITASRSAAMVMLVSGALTIEYSLLGVRDTTGSNAKISLAYLVHPTGLTTAFAAGK